jgi:S-adenosylmethionine hydrolase
MMENSALSGPTAGVPLVTLTSDFGTGSPYVAAMKGVILSISPAATIVDVTHDVRPQDVRHGALILEDVTRRFPPETIHVAVVDPGVGTDRAILYARIGRHSYVAPDNGLLSRLTRRTPPAALIRLTTSEYWLRPVSSTFHGRDIMAPVAAHLTLGLDPNRLGPPLERLVELDWPEPTIAPGKIEGEILDVDSFGNLVTNIDAEILARIPDPRNAEIQLGKYETLGIVSTYADRPQGTLIALVGSTGRLEISLVGGNVVKTTNANIGDRVTVRW